MGRRKEVYLKPKDTTTKHAIFQKHNVARRRPLNAHPGARALPGDPEHEPARVDYLDAISSVRELKRRKFRSSLFLFTKYCLGYPDLDVEAHGPLCDLLERAYWGIDKKPWHEKGIRKILVMLPRGTLKSTIVTISFPQWVLLQNDPTALLNSLPDNALEKMWTAPPSFNGKKGYNQRILISNLIVDNALQFIATIKASFSTGEELRDVFGNAAPERRVEGLWKAERCNITWRDDYSARDPNLQANGMDRSVNSGHFDIGIFDDMIDHTMVTNQEMVEKSINNYRNTQPLLEKPSLQIYVGTHWADQDLYAHFRESKEEQGQWEVLIEEADRDIDSPPMPPHHRLPDGRRRYFLPSKLDGSNLPKLRVNQGEYLFSCQYQNNPVPQKTAVFKKDYFKNSLYTLDGMSEFDLKQWLGTLSIHTTSDPAISKEKQGCQAVIVTCGWDAAHVCWVLDLFAEKSVHPSAFLEEFFRQVRAWDSVSAGIEEIGFQELYKVNAEQKSEKDGIYLPWVELKPAGRLKEIRIVKLEPLAKAGRLRYRVEHRAIEVEAIRFPRGKSRDILDALAYQLDVQYTPETIVRNIKEPDLNTFEYEKAAASARMIRHENRLKAGRRRKVVNDWYND